LESGIDAAFWQACHGGQRRMPSTSLGPGTVGDRDRCLQSSHRADLPLIPCYAW